MCKFKCITVCLSISAVSRKTLGGVRTSAKGQLSPLITAKQTAAKTYPMLLGMTRPQPNSPNVHDIEGTA